ncbi:hypothetical protein SFRURICE_012062, partial [Spodoptera frugiperda]
TITRLFSRLHNIIKKCEIDCTVVTVAGELAAVCHVHVNLYVCKRTHDKEENLSVGQRSI